ncbi:MAG: ABC transporter ATP-binding protein [Candidatus Gastranaerophilales bacterium]|nr:ABC transporter ATP-binding protein [Candidatus Gastranaerophilales bacterium]
MQRFLFNEILNKFYPHKKINFYLLIFSSAIAGLCEMLGLVLIFQFILFLSNSNAQLLNLPLENNPKTTLLLGLGVISIYVFKNIYMIFYTKLNNNILEDLALKMNLKMLNNLLFQDFLTVKQIENKEKTAIFSKINIVVWDYIKKYIDFFANLIVAIFLISFLFVKFTLCATITSIFVLILGFIEYKILKKKSDFQNENFTKTLNKVDFLIYSIVSFAKEIKLNNKENQYLEKINSAFKDFSTLNKEKSFNSVFHIYFTEIVIMITFGIVLFSLYYSLNFDNKLLLGSLCTICVVILRFAPTINRIQSSIYLINSNQKTAQELLKFNSKFDENCIFKKTKEKLDFKKSIKLENVSFSYDDNSNGLKNINLEIKKNEFIAIIGKSGSFKTTLALILAGLIKVQEGKILIDEKELSGENIQKWQNNVSFLSQDFVLLEENIKNNEELLKALDLENEKINALSSGQKQRMALFEILNQNKDILILDEITSNQDVITQEKINELLKNQKNKTIITIAHRLELLKNADKIIFLDNNVFDFDTFENLKNKHSEFQKMLDLSNIN